MNISVDLVLIIVNLLALAYAFGRFSEKIGQIEKKLADISNCLTKMGAEYYSIKEGSRLEQQISTMWDKYDKLPCKACPVIKTEGHNG